MHDFIQLLALHLSLKLIQRSEAVQNQEELEHILQGIRVPRRDEEQRIRCDRLETPCAGGLSCDGGPA
jgi:hypothetical protein